jgi:acyl-coenzyme A thioesterase PaaI-like protein
MSLGAIRCLIGKWIVEVVVKALPGHGRCFVCGDNPQGVGLQLFLREDGVVQTEATFTEGQQGPPGCVHGGASAAVLDEVMGAVVWAAGHRVVAVNLNIDLRRLVPLHVPVQITAWVEKQEGRKVYARSELRLADGETAVSGRGLFVQVDNIFENSQFTEEFEAYLRVMRPEKTQPNANP